MRIGVFTYGIHGQRMTGIARYAMESTSAMIRVDPHLDIILLNPYPEDDHPWYRSFPNHPMTRLRLLPSAATIGNPLLEGAARRLDLDVLFDPTGIAPFIAPQARHVRAVTVHDAIPYVYSRSQPLLTRLVFRTLIRAANRTADVILTVSRSAARDLHAHAGISTGKLRVALPGVADPPLMEEPEVDTILAGLGIQRPYLLYVGALHPRKNLPRVLRAFQCVASRSPHTARLVVVGPPSWGAHATLRTVRSATASSGHGDIVYTGFVDDSQLHALYAGSHGLVFPSLYEGFGLPVLEAMRRGVPVLTSDRSSLPEVAGDAALLVDPGDTGAIATRMADLLGDEALRHALSARGRKRALEFSWDHTAEEMLSVFAEAVDQRRRLHRSGK